MRTLLRIDASVRSVGSHSRALADHFQEQWQIAYPDGRILHRDLTTSNLPHLSNDTVKAFLNGADNEPKSSGVALSNELITELKQADDVVVSSPVYNFNVPSPLKAYVDHVVRFGHTVAAEGNGGTRGLLTGRSAYLLTASGGTTADQPDALASFLHATFRYMGFDPVRWIALEATAVPSMLASRLSGAKQRIESWFTPPATDQKTTQIEWRGIFCQQDHEEILALREAQIRAVISANVAAYAQLWTEDMMFMPQGQDAILGRTDFAQRQAQMLEAISITDLRMEPVRIDKQGNQAVELGLSEVHVQPRPGAAPVKIRRKYCQVYRKTAEGWRLAALIANDNS